ncbi:MAG: hypothetical protein K6F08_03685 [bacterium]|nr:hypothetical protein [bacterium]
MKLIKKRTAKILTIVISIIIAIGLFVTFVPISIGGFRYLSFAGNIKYGSDLKPGMYGEYVIDGTATGDDVNKSVQSIKSILEEYGYPNANVYSVSNSKIRVEIGNATNGNYELTEKMLDAIDVGVFDLRTSTDSKDLFINGQKHITSVSIGNSSTYTYVKITFNSEGLTNYLAKMKTGNTIYVYMGGDLQTSFQASTAQYDDLYLTFNDYASAYDFKLKVQLGSLVPVSFDKDFTEVNTMSPTLSNTGLTADINSAEYGKSDILVCLSLGLTFAILASLAYLAIKHRAFGIIAIITLLVETIIGLFFMQLFNAVEVSLTSYGVLAFGYAITIFELFIYINKVNNEFTLGKTIEASLDGGYKKSIGTNAAITVLLAVVGLLLIIFTKGAVKVSGIVLLIFGLAGGLLSMLVMPWFVKIYHGLNPNNETHYGFARRKN